MRYQVIVVHEKRIKTNEKFSQAELLRSWLYGYRIGRSRRKTQINMQKSKNNSL